METKCRICLVYNNLQQVFPERPEMVTLNQIFLTTGIQISEISELPKCLCMNCIYEIQNAYQLRVKAESSDAQLRAIYVNCEQETDIFSRTIKVEDGAMDTQNIVVKCEPWKSTIDLVNIDMFKNEYLNHSTGWPDHNTDVNCLEPNIFKKTKSSKKDRIKSESKSKKSRHPKMERPIETTDKVDKVPRERKKKLDSISTFVCVICGKLCNRKSVFEEHMFRHLNSRPYECYHCSKNFNSKKTLIRHMLTHTKDKKFQCDMCSNSYRAPHHLKCHKITSHGTEADKKYRCSACGKGFAYNYILNAHVKHYCKVIVGGTDQQLAQAIH